MSLNMPIICQTAKLYVSTVYLFEKYILHELFSTLGDAVSQQGHICSMPVFLAQNSKLFASHASM